MIYPVKSLTKAYLQPPKIPTKRYRRKPDSRRYIDYTDAKLKQCLSAIRAKTISQRAAAKTFNIPHSTIKNKLARRSSNKPGRQPFFTDEEEQLFIEHITALTKYGFPITNLDIKMIIRDYLKSSNKTIQSFRDNVPGKDWLKSFVERHPCLLRCGANKIYQARVTEACITEFMENISLETEDIPPENIYNYDEVLLGDDAAKPCVIGRRETKYLERPSKLMEPAFSVMFCGNAAGEALPPYIIFQSKYLDSTWTENGPIGAGYNSSKTGCIDSVTFEDWFLTHILPVFKKKKGRKIMIGDYLASHISRKVMEKCEKYRISFICLPMNSTHILQPLNFVYYQPLKLIWQELLQHWETVRSKHTLLSPESDYAYLLGEALNALTETKRNLISGFITTGIFPIDPTEPLSALVKHNIKVKNKKNNIRSEILLCEYDDTKTDSPLEDIETHFIKQEIKEEFYSSNVIDNSINSSDVHLIVVDGDDAEEVETQFVKQEIKDVDNDDVNVTNSSDVHLIVVDDDDVLQIKLQSDYPSNPHDINIGDHVMITLDTSLYPAQVLGAYINGVLVHCMKKEEGCWYWPEAVNAQLITWDHLVCKIDNPKFVKKGRFCIPEMNYVTEVTVQEMNSEMESIVCDSSSDIL